MAFIRGILDRIILVTSVVAVGCIPSFIAQYRQRVGSLQELMQHHLASIMVNSTEQLRQALQFG
jgi:hypothetical protein